MKKMNVKVIKKDEKKAAPAVVKTGAKTTKEAAREMVSTVTNWVSDFQQRKRDETKVAIEKFLSTRPRPSDA
jgi:hypothetical protein